MPAEKFLQRWDPEPPTPEELYTVAVQITAQLGGQIGRQLDELGGEVGR